MGDRRLERQLRRINGEAPVVRQLCAAVALVLLVAALLSRDTPTTSLALAMSAIAPGAIWLRRYNHARPRSGAIVYDIAAGAFLGALFTAIVIDPPASLHAWLRLPGERAAPAAVLVVVAAVVEDLGREVHGMLAHHD